MSKPACFVIAIKGTAGSGKSTLAAALAKELGGAVVLYLDDYERHPTSKRPGDFMQWIAQGADLNQSETPQLLEDLQALRRGESILSLNGLGELRPTPFVIVEDPHGREREVFKDLYDFVIAVDTPFDVTLARRLLRRSEQPHFVQHPDEFGKYVVASLHTYLDRLRHFYLIINQRLSENCDVVVDGMRPIDEQVQDVVKQIRTEVATRCACCCELGHES